MSTSFNFTYIVMDKNVSDAQGHPVAAVYPFWIKDDGEAPIRILHSSVPSITAKIYSGNPYPDFDYTEAVEQRIRVDIQLKADYGTLVAAQMNDTGWHLQQIITPSMGLSPR